MNQAQGTHETRIGAGLRAEREGCGWSLSDLAARSGVSRAMIGKIERGGASPTAALLARLSGAFGLTLSAFLARTEGSGSRLHREADQERRRDPATGAVRRRIAPAPGSDLPFDLVGIALPPGATVPASADVRRSDVRRSLVVVLEGRLAVAEGETAHDLLPGDSLELGPPADRTFGNAGDGPCSYLVAILRA